MQDSGGAVNSSSAPSCGGDVTSALTRETIPSVTRSTRLAAFVFALCAVTLTLARNAAAQGWMHWPTDRATSATHSITQGYYGDYVAYCGARAGCGTHNGYDYGIPVGTPLYGVAPGVVDAVNRADARTADYGGAGLWVRVRHDGATVPGLGGTHYVAYLHLSRIDVSPGAPVTTTTRIGLSGNTGGVAAHLHLHIATAPNYCSAPVDPGCPTPAWVGGSVVPTGFLDAPGCQSVCRPVPILWVQPAAYGNEPYRGRSACGDLDYAGRCEGETLRWCESGAPRTADCAALTAVCAFQDPVVGYNCLRCDPASMRALLPAPRCEGSRWLRCEGTTARSTNCDATGELCTPTGCRPMPMAMIPDAGIDADTFDATTNDVGAGDTATVPSDASSSIDASRPPADSGASVRDVPGDTRRTTPAMPGCGCVTVGASAARHGVGAVWVAAAFAALALVLARRRAIGTVPRP